MIAIYPGRSALQCMTHNARDFRLDITVNYEDPEILLGGSAIDAPDYIPSGSTRVQKINYVRIAVREVRREQP